jgi:hypothetical protein
MTHNPIDDPRCMCGAQTVETGIPCRKCHARSRWQRRNAHRDRSRRRHIPIDL